MGNSSWCVRQWRSVIGIILLSFSMVACGGGGSSGGGGASPAPAPTPPTSNPTPTPTPQTFSVSGSIAGNAFLVADSDVNDAFSTVVRNDTIATAQSIVAPAIIKGFVTELPTATAGDQFRFDADDRDFFEADLIAGQSIFLEIEDFDTSNPASRDLDIALFDSNGVLTVVSDQVNSVFEQMTVPTTGRYFIRVNAFSGASIYTLTISSELANNSTYVQRVVSRVSPTAISIERTPSAGQDVDDRIATMMDQSQRRRSRGYRKGDQIKIDARMGEAFSTFNAEKDRSVYVDSVDATNVHNAKKSAYRGARLRALEAVKKANALEGQATYQTFEEPRVQQSSDPAPNPFTQWNLFDIGWDEARALVEDAETEQGSPFTYRPVIAVIDSGYMTAHPEISPVLSDQREFVPASIDGDGFEAEAEEQVRVSDPGTCHSFHGTHVASIATAPINNQGIVGVLPGADVMGLKIGYSIDPHCETLPGDIVAAIRYAAGLTNASGALPPRRADIINLSIGTPTPSAAILSAIQAARAEGVIIVASAGNAGGTPEANDLNYPAAFDEVIAVAAVDLQRNPAYYSSSYPGIAVAAPGGDGTVDENLDGFGDAVVAAVGVLDGDSFRPGYAGLQGTSMASPHMAAGLAMMKMINPALTPDEIDAFLANGDLTVDLGTPGRDDETGFGLMSLPKMVDVALQSLSGATAPTPPPSLVVSPNRLNFGAVLNQITTTADILGTGSISVSSVTASDVTVNGQTWLTIDASQADGNGLGTYTFVVDRSGLDSGSYEGSVTFAVSGGDDVTVPVTVLNSTTVREAESAPIFFVFEQEQTDGSFLDVSQAAASEGIGGSISVTDLETGTYRITFGTDLDNDNTICDAGELCGTYPSSSNFTGTFELDGSLSNLTFTVTDFAQTVLQSVSAEGQESIEKRVLKSDNVLNQKTVGQ